jgi:hypothetical protein
VGYVVPVAADSLEARRMAMTPLSGPGEKDVGFLLHQGYMGLQGNISGSPPERGLSFGGGGEGGQFVVPKEWARAAVKKGLTDITWRSGGWKRRGKMRQGKLRSVDQPVIGTMAAVVGLVVATGIQ